MKECSRSFFLVIFCLFPVSLHAQADAEPEPISLFAFLVMCGFVLLAMLMVCSVGVISPGGKFGRVAMWLASIVSEVRIHDGSKRPRR